MSIENQPQRHEKDFFIYIIESPSREDFYDNRLGGKILSQVLSLIDTPAEHRFAVDLETFKDSLTIGLKPYLKSKPLPILHIIAHGDENGIQLTTGDFVSWPKLKELIIPINKELNGNLLLCMSSCKGFSALTMAMSPSPLDEPPFYVVIGPNEELTLGDATTAYTTFYHLSAKVLAKEFHIYSLTKIVEAMKRASGVDFQLAEGRAVQLRSPSSSPARGISPS